MPDSLYHFDVSLVSRSESLLQLCKSKNLKLATAESCTGGMIAGLLTEIAGSSAVYERGFVTYSNEAKQELLGVPEDMLDKYGAVSEPVAKAMAEGALQHARADIAVSVTGVAGPGGGTKDKPTGLVHFGCSGKGLLAKTLEKRFGDIGRNAIRAETILTALKLLEDVADQI